MALNFNRTINSVVLEVKVNSEKSNQIFQNVSKRESLLKEDFEGH